MTLAERLAAARADRRELEWVTRRAAEARADRERVAAQLLATQQMCAYEQADVDRLTRGIGGIFRSLFAGRAELSRETQELAAAQMQCAELEDELRAIDADLAQLATRAAQVADVEARYAHALAELEAATRARGLFTDDLDALAASEANLAAARREVAEAIREGVDAHDGLVLVVELVARDFPRRHGWEDDGRLPGEALLDAITGKTSAIHAELQAALAQAQQALRRFHHACADITTQTAQGLTTQFPPMGSVASFLVRDLLWTNQQMMESITNEASRISSVVIECVVELRGRATHLDAALAEVVQARASLLDPPRERL